MNDAALRDGADVDALNDAAVRELRLLRLLQLSSPALPVGTFSYSQGLEAAAAAGLVADAPSAERWIGDALAHAVVRLDGPILLRLWRAWAGAGDAAAADWNARFLASRESAELRAETVQMGYSLRVLLSKLIDARRLDALREVAFPTAFAFAAVVWDIPAYDALTGYLWAWIESQVMTAVKLVPLGQTEGQRMLLSLGERARDGAAVAKSLDDDSIGAFLPRLALLSAQHESQYSRLYRS
jgi:urease accessory protein